MKVIPYKRKRNGKTNYKKRLKLLKGRKTRLVIRKTNKNVVAQLVDYNPQGDKVLFQVNSRELVKQGWPYSRKNLPACYLTGYMLGKKAEGKLKEAILDLGLYTAVKGGRIFACLKGALDAGLQINHDNAVLPKEERIQGKHIVENFSKNKDKFTKSKNLDKIGDVVEQIKKKL